MIRLHPFILAMGPLLALWPGTSQSFPTPQTSPVMWIPVSHGRLEAALREPDGAPLGLALICHPHPQHGGTMHTKAVFRSAQALNEVGFTALRFNFRGVGTSTGAWDEGVGETEDARAALDFLLDGRPDLPVLVGGFSFGARIGLSVGVGDERVHGLLGLGLPLSLGPFDFLGSVPKPLLVVQGEDDEFGSGAEVAEVVRAFGPRATLKRIPGSDHYFTGHEDALKQAIRTWATEGPGASLLPS